MGMKYFWKPFKRWWAGIIRLIWSSHLVMCRSLLSFWAEGVKMAKQGQLYPLCFISMAPGLVRSVSQQLLRNHKLPLTLAFPLPRKARVSGASLSYRPGYSIGPPSLYENPWTPELHGVRASLQKVLLRIQSERFKSCYLIFSQYYIHFSKGLPSSPPSTSSSFLVGQYKTIPNCALHAVHIVTYCLSKTSE